MLILRYLSDNQCIKKPDFREEVLFLLLHYL